MDSAWIDVITTDERLYVDVLCALSNEYFEKVVGNVLKMNIRYSFELWSIAMLLGE